MRDEGQVIPHFYIEFVQDDTKTKLAGRPVMKSIERVTVTIGGDQTCKPVFKVEDVHRRRWPEAYAAFRASIPEGYDSGIALRGMPGLSLKREAELKAVGVVFVEQLLTGTEEEARRKFGPDAAELRKNAIAYMRGDLPPEVDVDTGDNGPDPREVLRTVLRDHGVKVDQRWGLKRLQQEHDRLMAPATE